EPIIGLIAVCRTWALLATSTIRSYAASERPALATQLSKLPKLPWRSLQGATATLALDRFFLISQCTRRAHAAFYLIERIALSLQSIIMRQHVDVISLYRHTRTS